MNVFADSFAFFAALNPRDSKHARVVEYFENYQGLIVTSEWVLVELADGFSHPNQRHTVVEFIGQLRADENFRIVGYDRLIFNRGFNLFAARPDKHWSLTDCISFSIMQDRGIADALTGDHHFAQAGFTVLFP